MRVLHVSSGNMYGGIESMLVTLARYRGECPGMEPHFALCFEGRVSAELRAAGVPVHLLGSVRASRPVSVWRARRAFRALLRAIEFDIVVCHSSWPYAIFGPVARHAGTPLAFWLHSLVAGTHWIDRWARRTRPDLIIANSWSTARTTAPLLHRSVRTEVVYYPVPAPQAPCATEREAVRRELGTPPDAVVIVQVSRMESWKGHHTHLLALSQLRDVERWVCWIVGGAQRPEELDYVRRLKAAAVALGISDRVHFVGQRADVDRLMKAADIFCQPNSGAEPFGIVFIEALYAGLPIVTMAMGGATEIVDESCGILVSRGDVDALAGALRELVADGRRREALGAAGPTRARALCDPPRQIPKLRDVCARLLTQ